MARDLALLGMMGVGKSTVAGALVRVLGRALVETDDLVAERAGKPIPDVFAEDGEAAFRDLERDVVGQLGAGGRARVISLGGGAVLDDRNIESLRRHAVLVELTAPVSVLVSRLSDETFGRPLLFGTDLAERLRGLVEERGARYRAVADHTVDASDDVTAVTADILTWAARQPDVLSAEEAAAVAARVSR